MAYVPPVHVPELQAATLHDVVLTQNVWETVLDTVRDVEVRSISFKQDTADEDIELRITDDSGTQTLTQTAVAATPYYVTRDVYPDDTDQYVISTAVGDVVRAGNLVRSRTFKVEIRKTTAAGANKTACKVLHSKWGS